MADVKISDLPLALVAALTMEFEVNDSGTSRRVTLAQLLTDAVLAGTPTAPTQDPYDDSDAIATTTYVEAQIAQWAINNPSIAGLTTSGRLTTAASATGGAGLRIPHGAAPTTPGNGDVWSTTAGLFIRINGVTIGPLSAGGTPFVNLTTTATTSAAAGTTYNCTGGTNTINLPASPAVGDAPISVIRNGSTATTVGRNGNTIAGSASDWVMNVDKRMANFTWSGTTWIVTGARIA
jgi:hypothetical protein